MIRAPLLSALPDIRHAFFTCEVGVSEGIYLVVIVAYLVAIAF
jgi:hypothetical protein